MIGEKNQFDETNIDKFFVSDGKIMQAYYNPDATSGGQLVYNELDVSLIRDAAKKHKDRDGFFDYLGGMCTQYLIDIDTPEFKGNYESFINRKADFEGCTDKTMKALKKIAGVGKEKHHRETER